MISGDEAMGCSHDREAMERFDREQFKRCGWYAHIVDDSSEHPYNYSYHTHGLNQTFPGALDILIVYPFPQQTSHLWANVVVQELKLGKRFKHGDTCDEICANLDVLFVNDKECDRPVLRLIFPDKFNCALFGKMEEKFGRQWGGIEPKNQITKLPLPPQKKGKKK